MPPPDSALRVAMYNHSGTGLHFLLGAEYERKKQKLQEELQVDYKRYIDQKRDLKAGVYNKSQAHGLSLPIAERISEKEKLREERNREYNLFLQEQAKSRRRGQFSVQPEEPCDFDTVHNHKDHSLPEGYRPAGPPTSRKDAATLTDIGSEKGRKTWDLRHQAKARIPFNMYDDENNNDQNLTSIAPHKQAKVAERPIPTTTAETSASVFSTGLLIGNSEEQDTIQKKKQQYKQALLSQIAEQRENKRKEKILELKVTVTGATDPHRPGILGRFGSENHTYEKWKQKVSSKPETGTIADKNNPELKNFPDSNIRMEHREPPGRPTIAFSTPMWDNNCSPMCGADHRYYSPDTSGEEYNRSFSHTLGEVTTKMVSAVPPPLPPRVDHTYKTPHDEAYNYYDKPEGPQEFEGSTLPQQKRTTHQPSWPSQPDLPLRDPSSESNWKGRENYQDALKQQVKDNAEHRRREKEERELYDAKKVNEMMTYNPWGRAGGGAPHIDQRGNLITDLDQMHKLNGLIRAGTPQAEHLSPLPGLEQLGDKEREHVQRQDHYKEALKQQIEENRRKQAEERERQKIMEENEEKRLAEERARLLKEYKEEEQRNRKKMQRKIDYEQWASEGKDRHKGKSIKDKPDNGRNSLGMEKEARPPSRERIARTTQEQREPQLTYRGNNGPKQEHYKESLKQQVEEKTQKQEEEREQQKIIEEKEEERLAEERSRILKEYKEEELRNRRKLQNKLDYKLWTNENKVGDQEKNKTQRGLSPPIPNFHQKPTNPNIPSATHQLSSQTDHLEEASQNAPEQVPGQEQHLQDYQEEVITELGTLRRILQNKKNHLETKLMQRDPANEHYLSETRPQRQVRQARDDAAIRGHRENVQFPTQKHQTTQENMQNLREFNQLKYRDTSSREELLHNYPDPPADWPSLDIQQQALLREQRRRLELMKRRDTEHHFKDFWDEQEDFLSNRNPSEEPVKSLPANTLFLEVYSCEEDFPHHSSAESQQRSSHLRRHTHEGEAIHGNKIDHFEPDAPSPSSDTIVHKVQQSDRHERPSEHQCGDDLDLLSGRSSRSTRERPVSVGTVAMEPWLQTSTSEPEHSGSRRPRAHL